MTLGKITYHQEGHEGALQEPGQHIAPVMFIIWHPWKSCVHWGSDQEKLDCGSQQPRPFSLESSLQIELRKRDGPWFEKSTEQLCLEIVRNKYKCHWETKDWECCCRSGSLVAGSIPAGVSGRWAADDSVHFHFHFHTRYKSIRKKTVPELNKHPLFLCFRSNIYFLLRLSSSELHFALRNRPRNDHRW